jgi:gliding motility-associated-like protein
VRDLYTHILKPNLRHYLFVLFTLVFTLGYTQLVFEQDIVQGGVTGAGFSTGQGSGVGTFDIYIEPGSTIKKAYLFTYRIGYPPEVSFVLNSTSHIFDSTNILMRVNHSSSFASPVSIYYKDLTAEIDPAITTFDITIPDQFGLPINWGYWTVYLIVIYENLTLNQTTYSLVINDKDFLGNEMYSLSNLNPVDVSNSVGFSLYTDRSGLSHLPPTKEVFINSNLLGVVGGSDNVNTSWGSAGVKGHFYYQNNELFGLDDDIANNVMSGTDGIANISTILPNNTTSTDFQMKHINYPNQANNHSNINLAYFLTYTTPCDIFQTDLVTEDTTICSGQLLQLGASGGINYNWLPQTGLSCYDCPNPEFVGDSSIVYTVRIWSTDSCSKVLPVKVKVLPQPAFTSINLTTSACGDENGAIVATASNGTAPYHYQLDGGANVGNGQFSGLVSSTYTLTVTDNNGCSADSTVFIDEEILVNASFTLEPPTGSAPLWVQSTNASTNATNYLWSWANETSTDTHPGFMLDTSGTYTVTLIAFNNFPECADTFTVQVVVYDSLHVVIPNVFTPNNDHSNDFFGITTNVPTSGTVVILNRWGNLIMEKDFTAQAHVFEPFWDGMLFGGEKATEGVYFYQVELHTENQQESYHGFVTLVR